MNIIIGLDVHSKATTKFCIQEKETGNTIETGEFETTYKGVKSGLGSWFKKYPQTEVGMETGNKTYYLSTVISELGAKPRVFSADEVRAKSRSKNKKSDYRDAVDICSNLRSGALQKEVQLPPRELKHLRTLLKLRELYVKQRTQITNQTRALMKEYAIADTIKSFSNKDSWTKLFKNEMPGFLKVLFKCHYRTYLSLSNEIKMIEKKLADWNNEHQEFELLKTIPGIGDITCAALKAFIFDINRFHSAKHLVSYLGLAPSCHDSGETERHGRITKEGNSFVRKLLVECTHHYSYPKSCFYPFFVKHLNKKGYKKACVALAAKLCRIIYAMLIKSKSFDLALLGVKKGPFDVVKKYHYLVEKNNAKVINASPSPTNTHGKD